MINTSVSNIPADPKGKPNRAGKAVQGPEHAKKAPTTILNMGVAAAYYLILQAAKISSHTTVIRAKQLQANGLAQQVIDDEEGRLGWNSVPKLKYHEKTIGKAGPRGRGKHPNWGGKSGWGGHSAGLFAEPGKNPGNPRRAKSGDAKARAQPKNSKGKNKIQTQDNFHFHAGPIHVHVGKHGASVGVGGDSLHASKTGAGLGGPGFSVGWGGKKYRRTPANLTAINEAQWANEQTNGLRQIFTQQVALMQQNAQVGETDVDMSANSLSKKMQEDSAILQILKDLTFKALLRQQPQ